jgi:hypothetical protein
MKANIVVHINFGLKHTEYENDLRKGLRNMNLQQFLQFIREQIKILEFHEIDEWFKYNGENVTDPHPERKMLVMEIPSLLADE